MSIDWSKAPEGTTGAMVAHFDSSVIRRGDVEFIPSDETFRSIYREGPDSWVYHPAPSATHWNGEGLPPAGSLVDAPIDDARYMCELLAIDGEECAVRMPGAIRVVNLAELRAIRTPEQIAAEERESEVGHIERCINNLKVEHQNNPRVIAEVLHNIGYRKAK